MIHDYASAPIGEDDRAMLGYVDKLTRAPGDMSKKEVDQLREAGFTDVAILDVCQGAAYYAFANRIANGLGVELESESPNRNV